MPKDKLIKQFIQDVGKTSHDILRVGETHLKAELNTAWRDGNTILQGAEKERSSVGGIGLVVSKKRSPRDHSVIAASFQSCMRHCTEL